MSASAHLGAVVFDAYGTLLRIGRKSIHRDFPRLLRTPRDRWVRFVRDGLLTRSFPDVEAFAAFAAEALDPEGPAEAKAACAESVRAEVGSVSAFPGVPPLLQFLKRRGLKLGLVSNLASPFKAPLETLGLLPLFDVVLLSCDEGRVKPDPAVYARLLERLGVAAESVLFVGDSSANDIAAPAALGMRTAGVGGAAGDVTLSFASEIAFLDLDRGLRPLVAPGGLLPLPGGVGALRSLEPVPDDEQGRYNVIFAGEVEGTTPSRRVYLKRFLLPETAELEAFAYRLQRATGLQACEAAVLPGAEPLLAVTEAPGRKLSGEVREPEIAFEAGRHFAFGFLFSNADLRPRNTFEDRSGGRARLTVVDLEHCLFNLAIATEGIGERFAPETFDRMGADEIAARLRHRVLSPRTSSRARRTFLPDAARGTALGRAFDEGFLAFCAEQQAQAKALLDMIAGRLAAEPHLVIGTQSYRRAMARLDLEDIAARLGLEPREALAWMW
ncbi:MAG TPA: HAD-IA family hydrolase [Thermoanaerobaculia bacterium]|nr:HAD-IA family hydrolase [Thermoanaerobaculia bacterium]